MAYPFIRHHIAGISPNPEDLKDAQPWDLHRQPESSLALHRGILYQRVMDGAIPIEVSVLCVLRREENSRYRLLLVV
jgi:hypothetical protein